MGDLYGRVVWESYIGELCGRVVWESCVGELYRRLVWENCVGELYGLVRLGRYMFAGTFSRLQPRCSLKERGTYNI